MSKRAAPSTDRYDRQLGQRIRLLQRKHQVLACNRFDRQIDVVRQVAVERDQYPPLPQCNELRRLCHVEHDDFYRRVRLQIAAKDRRHDADRAGSDDSDIEATDGSKSCAARAIRCVVDESLDLAGAREQFLTRRREIHSPLRTLEEQDA
jgi:hypothetical protein